MARIRIRPTIRCIFGHSLAKGIIERNESYETDEKSNRYDKFKTVDNVTGTSKNSRECIY